MKPLKKIILLTLFITFIGCDNKDDDNTEPAPTFGTLTINFNHYWDGEKVTSADFDNTVFANANGDKLTISKLRYLISNLTLHQANGTSTKLSDYYLVDLAGLNSNTSITISDVPIANFSNATFTFGFNETDNVDGAYTDLNSASWNWPEMFGGGYHFMQFEGKYGATGTENPYAYHMGTARVSAGVFEQNYIDVTLDGFTTTGDATLEIKMNIDEWFKNPNTWDLNVYDTSLMPNYDAQIMMRQNGRTVFRLGEVN